MKYIQLENGYNSMGRPDAEYESTYMKSDYHMASGLHCHDFYELYIHYRGGNLYYVDGQIFPLEPNQIVIMTPFRMHGLMRGDPLTNYVRGFLYLRPCVLKRLGFGQIDLQQYFDSRVQAGEFVFKLDEDSANTCRQLLIDIQRDMDVPDEMTQYINYSRMNEYVQLFCQAAQKTAIPLQPFTNNEVIFNVLQYVNDHFTEPLTLEDIARSFAISVSYLSHEFKHYAGRSVYEYILYRRVQLAKENLLTDMSLSEVSEKSGFCDYSGFLRTFRRMTGMSPKAYQKQHTLSIEGK